MRRPLRGGGEKADPTKYGDFTVPHVASAHKNIAYGFGTTMWFWMFYRAYYDLPT
jgi:hypothetical protein